AMLVCFVAGCETPGHSLDESAVAQIRDGLSTKADVGRIFGEPTQMTKSDAGKTLYYYERFYGPSARETAFDESHLLVLTVLFDSAGVVEKHLHSHTKPDVSARTLRFGRKLDAEQLARIVPKKTKCADLESWFGPYALEMLTLNGDRLVRWEYANGYNVAGQMDSQILDVIVDEGGSVSIFRVTKRDPSNR